MKVANAIKYDGHGEIMFYSDLKNHSKWKHLYNDKFDTNDFTIIIRNIEGKPVVQMYSFFNYRTSRYDHLSKGLGLLDNFIDRKTAIKNNLALGNTESARNNLELILLRNHFHNVGAEVLEVGHWPN